MFEHVDLRKNQEFAVLNAVGGLLHHFAGAAHIVALESQKPGILHRHVSHRLRVLFVQSTLESFEEQVFGSFIVRHSAFKRDLRQHAFQVVRRDFASDVFVDFACLLHLALLFFKKSILQKQLH